MSELLLHFYDLIHIGSPSYGQPIHFDSVLHSGLQRVHQSWNIRLRPDVVFNPMLISQTEAFDQVTENGITEYEWVRAVEPIFQNAKALHIGLGSSGQAYDHLRYSLYRCLSTVPASGNVKGRHQVDLLTVIRAMAILRPSDLPFKVDPCLDDQKLRILVRSKLPGASAADSAYLLIKALYETNPRFIAYAISISTVEALGEKCGLVNQRIESLSLLRPVLVSHESLMHPSRFGAFMAMGTDPEFENIVYMVDLNADLSCVAHEPDNLEAFIRENPGQTDRPIIRLNLSRLPFISGLAALDSEGWGRTGMCKETVAFNIGLLRGMSDLSLELCELSAGGIVDLSADPEFQLFSTDYIPSDIALLDRIHKTPFDQWPAMWGEAHDQRIARLAEGLIRRFATPLHSKDELQAWNSHCAKRLLKGLPDDRVAALNAYCRFIIGTPSAPVGMRTAAKHWLSTTLS